MKNFGITVGLALIICALAFGLSYAARNNPELHRAAATKDTMAWLRTEFHLSDQQFAAIKKLHDEYGLVCDQECAEIMSARRRGAAPDELRRLDIGCVEAMRNHFKQVAARMPPGEGERYLASVLPYVATVPDVSAPDVRAKP